MPWTVYSFQSSSSQPQQEQSLFVQHFPDEVLHVFILHWHNFLVFHPWHFYHDAKQFCWSLSKRCSGYKTLSHPNRNAELQWQFEAEFLFSCSLFPSHGIYFGLVCLLPSPQCEQHILILAGDYSLSSDADRSLKKKTVDLNWETTKLYCECR